MSYSSVLYNGKIYSWGGRSLNTMDVYDIASNTWPTGITGTTVSTTTTITVRSTPQPPTPPNDLTETPHPSYDMACTGSYVTLTWTDVAGATNYTVNSTTTDSSAVPTSYLPFHYINSTSTLYSYDDYIVSADKGKYKHYSVEACNTGGCSTKSNDVSVSIPSTCGDINTFSQETTTSICSATQGIPAGNKIYVNKQMQWNATGIPTNATTTWSGKDLTSTTTLSTLLNKIYTTVGLKTMYATSTWIDMVQHKRYTATCSTSTNVILGGDVIREI